MRDCGDCQACCTLMHVPALDKAKGAPCPHAEPGRCAIYAERPEACRRFACLWLQGFGREAERPDRAGAMLGMKGRDVVVHEATAGAGSALAEMVGLLRALGHPIWRLSDGKAARV